MQPGAAVAHVLRLVLRLQRLNRVRVFVTVFSFDLGGGGAQWASCEMCAIFVTGGRVSSARSASDSEPS